MEMKRLYELFEYSEYETNVMAFQKALRKITPFKDVKQEEIPLELLETFVFKLSLTYDFKPQWITFTNSSDKQCYTLAMVRESDNEWLGTVYGNSIYELFAKFSLKIFYEISNKNVKKV